MAFCTFCQFVRRSCINGSIGQFIRRSIVSTFDVLDARYFVLSQKFLGLISQRFQEGALDFVFSLKLVDQKLAVQPDQDGISLIFSRFLQALDQSQVFRLVVGFPADELGHFFENPASFVFDHHPDAGRAWVASRRTVGVDD